MYFAYNIVPIFPENRNGIQNAKFQLDRIILIKYDILLIDVPTGIVATLNVEIRRAKKKDEIISEKFTS